MKTWQYGFMLQILTNWSGNKTETGLSYKQTLLIFDKPFNAFLSKAIILFDSKFISFKLIKPLKSLFSILVIYYFFAISKVEVMLSLWM